MWQGSWNTTQLEHNDEIPAAYKDIDEVISQQSDLVHGAAHLRAVLCVKG